MHQNANSRATIPKLKHTPILIIYWCPLKLFSFKKLDLTSKRGNQPFSLPLFLRQNVNNDGEKVHIPRTAAGGIAIYRKRWEIELLFKQLKQNFPLRYFYGESTNAIKIQVRVTLIANLLLMVLQRHIKCPWSFSGLATMVRIMLMYYVNCYTYFESPEKDCTKILENARKPPPEFTPFD